MSSFIETLEIKKKIDQLDRLTRKFNDPCITSLIESIKNRLNGNSEKGNEDIKNKEVKDSGK